MSDPPARTAHSALLKAIAALLISGAFIGDVAVAQDSPFAGSRGTVYQEGSEVRRSARDILSAPEFRHFRRSRNEAARSGSGSGSGGPGGSGSGSPGGPGGGGAGQGRSGGDRAGGDAEKSPRSASDSDRAGGSSAFPSSAASGAGAVFGSLAFGVTVMLLVGIGLLILYLIAQALMGYDPPTKLSESPIATGEIPDDEPEQAPGELPADVYIARARELADRGEYREALAHLLLGAMSHIERAGLVRYRRGLTCRDYLRAVRPRRQAFEAMQKLVRLYEPLGFGRREAERSHFEDGLSSYQAGFRGTVNPNTH